MSEIAPTRRESRRLRTREQVLETALRLFETHGYEATTVTEIVRHADIAYGTFFNHFPTKLDLLREISDRSLCDLFESVEEVRKLPGGFAGKLVALFESSSARAEEKGPRMRELTGAMMSLAFPESGGHEDRRIRLAFGAILADGLAAGELREGAELDIVTEIVVGTWYSLFLSWVHFENVPLRERASRAGRFLAEVLIARTAGESQ